MIRSVGLIEFNSIARGMVCCDEMLKSADVALIKASTLCPGKYIVLIAGDTGSVKAAMEVGIERGEHYVVNVFEIPNVDQQIIPAIHGTNEIPYQDALGIMEFYSISSAIKAADTAVKAADVYLIDVKIGYAIGGKGVVILTGEIGAVKAAVEAGNTVGEEDGYMLSSEVIPRPSTAFLEALVK